MWYNINRTGRLGNRLFSRAHVYAAALEYGETVIDWGVLDFKDYFPNLTKTKLPIYPFTREGEIPNYPINKLCNKYTLNVLHKLRPRITGTLGNFWNQHYGKGNPEDMRTDTKKFQEFVYKNNIVFLNGYKLRCPKWVKKHRIEICKYFQVPKSYSFKWLKLKNDWKQTYDQIVGLHIRRSDFKTAMRGDFYLSPSEYAEILKKKLPIDFNNTLIVVFSEDRFIENSQWEAFRTAFSFTNFILNNGSVIDDLSGLMSCDKIVGPETSTFSRWAAFAGEKPWAGLSRNSLDTKDLFEFKKCPIPWDYTI